MKWYRHRSHVYPFRLELPIHFNVFLFVFVHYSGGSFSWLIGFIILGVALSLGVLVMRNVEMKRSCVYSCMSDRSCPGQLCAAVDSAATSLDIALQSVMNSGSRRIAVLRVVLLCNECYRGVSTIKRWGGVNLGANCLYYYGMWCVH